MLSWWSKNRAKEKEREKKEKKNWVSELKEEKNNITLITFG